MWDGVFVESLGLVFVILAISGAPTDLIAAQFQTGAWYAEQVDDGEYMGKDDLEATLSI